MQRRDAIEHVLLPNPRHGVGWANDGSAFILEGFDLVINEQKF